MNKRMSSISDDKLGRSEFFVVFAQDITQHECTVQNKSDLTTTTVQTKNVCQANHSQRKLPQSETI